MNPTQPVRIWVGFGFNFSHKLGRILDLSNFTDSDLGLGSALTLSRVWIWTWIQFLLQFGSDSESFKFNGFGFGLGFKLFYGLGWIQNPLSITDSDLDSTCSMDQNLGEL